MRRGRLRRLLLLGEFRQGMVGLRRGVGGLGTFLIGLIERGVLGGLFRGPLLRGSGVLRLFRGLRGGLLIRIWTLVSFVSFALEGRELFGKRRRSIFLFFQRRLGWKDIPHWQCPILSE
jgi:hypothetical protein